MGRLVQICASHNHLFGLDEQGDVYQYNFNTKAWVKLAHGPREGEAAELVGEAARTGYRDAAESRR
jgi:hypothetical protein